MIFGLIKPQVDAHTLGISSIASLLRESGYQVFLSQELVSKAVENLEVFENREILKNWLLNNNISSVGLSYRLDPKDGFVIFNSLMTFLKENKFFFNKQCRQVFFAGLPEACELVSNKFGNQVKTFPGDETPSESLSILEVPKVRMPKWLISQQEYDSDRYSYAQGFLSKTHAQQLVSLPKLPYRDYGGHNDTILKRVNCLESLNINLPLTRAHVGPYLENKTEALAEFSQWLNDLEQCGNLDIVSIGSSQLTQEKFGENWEGLPNGGGVPISNEQEFRQVKKSAGSMLVRSYSATDNVAEYAEMLEKTINNAWHALSFWWFNLSDGRGPLTVYETLIQHTNTLKIISHYQKPFEPNISHHFSFRGADDLSGIVATYLVVKLAKLYGVRSIVLQMMLNTPKIVSGVGDIAKFRVLLKLVKGLEDKSFKIIEQPRAGLSYFSPDIEKAQVQLSSVSMLMTDLLYKKSPKIVHVVSYSEAIELANPEVINHSCQITRTSIKNYLKSPEASDIFSKTVHDEIIEQEAKLFIDATKIIIHMERNFKNLYTPEGLYNVYKVGYFPVPHLWSCRDEFKYAVNWNVGINNGQVVVMDKLGMPLKMEERLSIIEKNILDSYLRSELK